MTARLKLAANLHWPLFLTMAVTICSIETWLVTSAFFLQNPDTLTFAITFDIALGIPILYYFFAVRKKHAPPLAVILIFVLSLILAGLILPVEQHTYLDLIKTTIPFIELITLGYIAAKIRAIIKNFQAAKQRELYFRDALAESCKRVLGNLPALGLILTEFSLLYFALGGWFKKFENLNSSNTPFSYHRKSGYAAILGVIIMVLITETLALHLLLQQWSALAAWIFTGLSVYGLFWMLGDYQAMRLHPIILGQEFLFIRTGMRRRATLPLVDIAAIEKFNSREKRAKDYLGLSVFGDPRLVIHCKHPVVVLGLFGIKREVSRIGLAVDDEKRFVEALQQRLSMMGMK